MLMTEGLMPAAHRAAVSDLERFTGRRMEELAAAYWSAREGCDHQAQALVSSAHEERTVVDYYRQTRQYLYELSYVEGGIRRQGWLRVLERACRRLGLRHVLDVGGGVGTVSLFLQARGIRCDYLDVPGHTWDYATWRFSQHGLQVSAYDATGSWPPGPYDGIIAWDVLEHLKDLEEKAAWISQRLRTGGVVLHWSTFNECEGVHLPENRPYADVRLFDAMLRRHDLEYRGQLKADRCSRFLRRLGWRTATAGIQLHPRLKFGGCFLVHGRTASPAAQVSVPCTK
jgi:2-polyprenyl-3-methyl-5-hydroxy-6-metoxy-1,4-benzoquinol methylase